MDVWKGTRYASRFYLQNSRIYKDPGTICYSGSYLTDNQSLRKISRFKKSDYRSLLYVNSDLIVERALFTNLLFLYFFSELILKVSHLNPFRYNIQDQWGTLQQTSVNLKNSKLNSKQWQRYFSTAGFLCYFILV